MDVMGDGSKIQCGKEQYCIGTWNVRSMNQGKLEVVKEEMARVNINILGISELKWTGMDEFNSDDHHIFSPQCVVIIITITIIIAVIIITITIIIIIPGQKD